MTALELLRAGRLEEAIRTLGDDLRANPLDTQRRSFLFELLCFAGQYDRAEKQLDVLAQAGPQAELGVLLYRAAIRATRAREDTFATATEADPSGVPTAGRLNGADYEDISDADRRLGARLEILLAGRYLLVPFAHIESVEIAPPRQLRDLLWAPAMVRTGPAFEGRDLGEVLVPVLSPFSWRHPDDAVRLGRTTVWEETSTGVTCFGQKLFRADEEEIPLLELREMEFTPACSTTALAS